MLPNPFFSHIHESCPPFLEVVATEEPVVPRSQRVHILLSDVRVSLAISLARHFVVIVAKYDPASKTVEATGMELPTLVRLHILAFNATVASPAERSVELMVVLFTIWSVVENVEFGGGKWRLAGLANEALFVIAPGEATG
jgi:hypothetical protein